MGFATPNPTDVSLRLSRGREKAYCVHTSSSEEIIGQEGKEEVLAGALTLPRMWSNGCCQLSFISGWNRFERLLRVSPVD